MSENPVIRKLQLKEQSRPVLVLNAPEEYKDVAAAFEGGAHTEPVADAYSFVQVFGASNAAIQAAAREALRVLEEDGLLWLCYPKKTSKRYKGSDCSRESVAVLLADEGYEPVRQIAIDDDWSALRFRHVDRIKTMVREFAVTETGKRRTEK